MSKLTHSQLNFFETAVWVKSGTEKFYSPRSVTSVSHTLNIYDTAKVSQENYICVNTIDVLDVPINNYKCIKIDIEGFEDDLFAQNIEWVDEFSVIIIETHDRFFPKMAKSKNFLKVISGLDRDFVHRGENIFSIKNQPNPSVAKLKR